MTGQRLRVLLSWVLNSIPAPASAELVVDTNLASCCAVQFMMPQGSRSRLRRDEMRTIVAHIYRLVAADLRPAMLQEDSALRTRITDWIIDTLRYLQSATAGNTITPETMVPSYHHAFWLTLEAGSVIHKHKEVPSADFYSVCNVLPLIC